MPENAKIKNRLLAALPQKEYRNLLSKSERIALVLSEHIYEADGFIRYVYFPESGIVSLLSTVGENSTLEVGIVGNEGMVGLPVFLGVEKSDNRAVVQGAGFALRMTAEDFTTECRRGELPQLLQRFTHSLMIQISQSAACNRFHQIEARLARWLLMTGDRMQADEFQITQEFLSNMLGVRREAVNKSAANFQRQQLLTYNRGNLSILDRTRLKAAACPCYQIIRNSYENFLD